MNNKINRVTNKWKLGLVGAVLLLVQLQGANTFAQQDPLFTQYMFNTLSLNPAYAGSTDMLSAMLLSRQQWVGFEGAPSTQSFSIHTPVYASKVGVGGSIVNDITGPVQQTGLYLDYAYHLNVNEGLHLSMGLKGGFNYYSINLNKLSKEKSADNAYNDPKQSSLLPNFGFGLYLYSSKYYVGASAPKLLENKYDSSSNEEVKEGKETRHYFFTAGGIIDLENDFVLKPSILTRVNMNAPISIDLNVNAIYLGKIWLGAMYRVNEAFGGIVQYQINNQFRFGYAFDQNTNQLSSYHDGSHEIMLNYDLNFKKEKVQNPRYF